MTLMTREEIEIAVQGEEEDFPFYATDDAAGADVRAKISHPLILAPGKRALIPTGLSVELPQGYEIQVRPRSGLAYKHGITVLNTPGTIDSDYRGEIGVLLINLGEEEFTITPGMRIAQLVVMPTVKGCFVKEERLTPTMRDVGGFGHTGV